MRILPPSEADSLTPLAREIARKTRTSYIAKENDPLAQWFGSSTVGHLRNLESRIRQHLIGEMTISPHGTHFENISSLAATFYVALFAICRKLASSFQSSNPTWLRVPKAEERRVGASRDWIVTQLTMQIIAMAAALKERAATNTASSEAVSCDLRLADSTQIKLQPSSVDLILTSPPYCTRIDYTAATRIELAILAPLMETTAKELSRQMIGSTCVPNHEIELSEDWGNTCGEFLLALKKHPSKASSGYYYKTHVDYFQKMGQSLSHLATALAPDGLAILVVQDSYYKELHNDLPQIICEMGEGLGLKLIRRAEFRLQRSMA